MQVVHVEYVLFFVNRESLDKRYIIQLLINNLTILGLQINNYQYIYGKEVLEAWPLILLKGLMFMEYI